MTDLEKRFDLAMHDIYLRAKAECNCKHLNVEAHVLLPEYAELFTEEEKRIARSG